MIVFFLFLLSNDVVNKNGPVNARVAEWIVIGVSRWTSSQVLSAVKVTLDVFVYIILIGEVKFILSDVGVVAGGSPEVGRVFETVRRHPGTRHGSLGKHRDIGAVARVHEVLTAGEANGNAGLRSRQEDVVQLAGLDEGLVVRVAVNVLVRIAQMRVQVGGTGYVVEARRVFRGALDAREKALIPGHSNLAVAFPWFTPNVTMDVLVLVAREREIQVAV